MNIIFISISYLSVLISLSTPSESTYVTTHPNVCYIKWSFGGFILNHNVIYRVKKKITLVLSSLCGRYLEQNVLSWDWLVDIYFFFVCGLRVDDYQIAFKVSNFCNFIYLITFVYFFFSSILGCIKISPLINFNKFLFGKN